MTPEQLKKARQELGLTQSQLGKALRLKGDGSRAVRHWESGKREISGPVSLAIEMLLALPPDQRQKWLEG